MNLINRKLTRIFLISLLLLTTACGKQEEDVSETETVEEEIEEKYIGVMFVGMQGSAMTLYNDGTADYYWIQGNGIEERNTWMQKDDIITIHLSSLNCDIYTTDNDKSSLFTFQSDSINWDEELFIEVGNVSYKPSEAEYYQLVQEIQTACQRGVEILKSSEKNDSKGSDISEDMRPEFKEAMDSIEAFYDEYCEFVKKYNANPDDLTLLTKYSEMLSQAVEMNEKLEAWDEEEMNMAEQKYYIEVCGRITQKLLEVTE